MTDETRKKELLAPIVGATTLEGLRSALATFRLSFGFPDDEQAIAKVLDLEDGPTVIEALGVVGRLVQEGRWTRIAPLRARLRTAQATARSAEVRQLAGDLLTKL
jgi:hypothetical protein